MKTHTTILLLAMLSIQIVKTNSPAHQVVKTPLVSRKNKVMRRKPMYDLGKYPLTSQQNLTSRRVGLSDSLWTTEEPRGDDAVLNTNANLLEDISRVIYPNYGDQPIYFSCAIATREEELLCSASVVSIHFAVSSCLRCLTEKRRPIAPQSIVIMIPQYPAPFSPDGISFNVYNVERVLTHPGCLANNNYTVKFDIGIVKTIEAIEFSQFVQPAKILAQGLQPDLNRNMYLTTLNVKNTKATTDVDALWFVKVRLISDQNCENLWEKAVYGPGNAWCTPYCHAEGDNDCKMDFGASLSYVDFLIGILIHKSSCGCNGKGAAYVDISLNSKWLRQSIQELSNFSEDIDIREFPY